MCLYRLCNQPWQQKTRDMCSHLQNGTMYTVPWILFPYIKHLTNTSLGKSLLTIIIISSITNSSLSYIKVSTVKSTLTNVVSSISGPSFSLQCAISMTTGTLFLFPIATQQNGDQCLMHLCAKSRLMYLSIMIICFNIIAMETCLHSNRFDSSKFLVNQLHFNLILLSSTSMWTSCVRCTSKYNKSQCLNFHSNQCHDFHSNHTVDIHVQIIHFPRGNNGIFKKKRNRTLTVDCELRIW